MQCNFLNSESESDTKTAKTHENTLLEPDFSNQNHDEKHIYTLL
jgi:hypothetical protein